jgi:hypothetical protein
MSQLPPPFYVMNFINHNYWLLKMGNRTYFYLIATSSGLFLILFFIVSYYNRLAADDFYYLGGYAEKGVWSCMRDLYFGYSGRWTAYLLTGFVVSLNQFKYSLFIFNCITISALIFCIRALFKNIFNKITNKKLSNGIATLYAIILTCSLFFSCYSIAETWFWLVQVCTYLWSIIMSIILINIILHEKTRTVHYFTLAFAAIFIGGASESYALVNIFLLVTFWIMLNFNIKYFSWMSFFKNSQANRKIIIALIFLIASFMITMMAPGNEIRYSALPKVSFDQTLWIQIKSFIKIIFIKTPVKFPYLFLFSCPWLILGIYFSSSVIKKNIVPAFLSMKKYIFFLLTLVFIFLIPTSFIMSELGPHRALSQISFLISIFFAAAFFYFGYSVELNSKMIKFLKTGTVIISIGLLVFHILYQSQTEKKYAIAYDERMRLLSNLKTIKRTNEMALEPLPYPGMIYSAEISEDTSYFTNNFLEYALHLNFNVKKKNKNYL